MNPKSPRAIYEIKWILMFLDGQALDSGSHTVWLSLIYYLLSYLPVLSYLQAPMSALGLYLK